MSDGCAKTYHESGCGEFLQSASFCIDPCVEPDLCVELVSTDCIIYSGPDYPCYGIFNGMFLTEVLDILSQLTFTPCPTTTTTTSTTTTSTSTTSTTTTTTIRPTTTSTTTSTTSTTTTTLIPGGCICYIVENRTAGDLEVLVYPCAGGVLEVNIPGNTTEQFCVANGTVPTPRIPGPGLVITPCLQNCLFDSDCDNC